MTRANATHEDDMTPAEIAAKLTPAQVGALRLARITPWLGLNKLGRAVLAALDAKEAGNE